MAMLGGQNDILKWIGIVDEFGVTYLGCFQDYNPMRSLSTQENGFSMCMTSNEFFDIMSVSLRFSYRIFVG